MTAIALKGLSKHYGKTVAVDSVDLTIASGELFFLLGPSGCGKTTILRMIAGFIEPTAGRVFFDQRDVTNLAANKRNVGMVFQSYALWPHMTVAENVAFGLKVRKVSKAEREERVTAALDLVQMRPYARRKPNQLSGGQQQRVALARALVINPGILLLDEPLSNLDAKLRLEMRSQIRQICDRTKVTAVYVTHDQKEALSMADRIAVLKDGRVMQVGRPRELYERPRSRFVCDFLGETNFLPAKVMEARDGRIELETAAGRLISSAGSAVERKKGAAVVCSLRPEALRIAQQTDRINCLPGELMQTIYLGEVAQHIVRLKDGMHIRALELHLAGQNRVAGTLKLCVAPGDVVILDE